MIITIKLSTTNTTSGNPRRLHIVHDLINRERLDVIEEGYQGWGAVVEKYPSAAQVQEIEVTPSEYNRWVRVGKNDAKLRAEDK